MGKQLSNQLKKLINHNIKLFNDGSNIKSKDFELEFLGDECLDIQVLDYNQSIFFGEKIPSKKICFKIKNQTTSIMKFK